MKSTLALAVIAFGFVGQANADPLVPFIAHRAAYAIRSESHV